MENGDKIDRANSLKTGYFLQKNQLKECYIFHKKHEKVNFIILPPQNGAFIKCEIN
jgi:hypothetical protein